MKKNRKGLVAALGMAAMMLSSEAKAQNEFTVSGKADFVTDYVWRGADQNAGFSIQPSLTLGYGGLSLNVWGSQSVSTKDAKEFDLNLSYAIHNFSVTVSDYWWSGVDQPYGDYSHDHYFEGTLAYNFGESFPLSISWSTMFAGADKDEKDDNAFSSYINLSYPISLPADITLTPAVGMTPWKSMYNGYEGGFDFTDISLKASKDLKVTENFSIPMFVQALVSPVNDRTYLLAGFSVGF